MGGCSSKRSAVVASGLSIVPGNDFSDVRLVKVKFIKLGDLKQLGRTPRNPEDRTLLKNFVDINRDEALMVFVSHCWLRGHKKAPGYDGKPHPDTPNDDKLKLIIEACDKIHNNLCPDIKEVYVWLDYGCINQEEKACDELKMLDVSLKCCDVMLTPIYDSNVGGWYDEIESIDNWFEQYGSPAWNSGENAYINRGWCRVEMMYASNIPILPCSDGRKEKFKASLWSCVESGRRPHMLYGSNESNRKISPIVLPPMSHMWFNRYKPTDGHLTEPTDRDIVEQLVENLKPFIKIEEDVYEGDYNMDGKKHGRGTHRFADGGVYEGEFANGKHHGQGMYRYVGGAVYEGEWKSGNMDGKGIYQYADGAMYEGEFRDNSIQGKGIYRYATGAVYEGDFVDGKSHGKGIEWKPDGSVRHYGEWRHDKPFGESSTSPPPRRPLPPPPSPITRNTSTHSPSSPFSAPSPSSTTNYFSYY